MNLIDSVFMPVGVNTAYATRRYSAAPPALSRGHQRSPGNTSMTETMIMFRPASLRPWATPLTIGAFVLMAISGVMMFFEVMPGYVTSGHKWLSWLFLLGAGAHIILNNRALVRHLGSAWGRASLTVFTLALIVSTFSFGQVTVSQLEGRISRRLVEARLSTLADLTQTNEAGLLRKLAAHGVKARADQKVKEVAARHGIEDFHVLALVFLEK